MPTVLTLAWKAHCMSNIPENPSVVRALMCAMLVAFAPVSAQPSVPANGASNSRMQEAIRLFDTWLDADVAFERVPGLAIGVVIDQQLVWSHGYGFADAAQGIPVTAATPFSICSISKLFTASAVMQLRDAGKISLDEPVRRYLPSFNARGTLRMADAVTMRRLLTHASGLPRDFPYASWTGPDYPFPTRAQVADFMQSPEQVSAPGSRYEYSNVGMTLAGNIVESVSGLTFDDYVRTNIFQPLGMTHSFTDQTGAARAAGLAAGFSVPQRTGARVPIPAYEVRGLAPVAGVVSTIEDMARFATWQLNGAVAASTPVLRAASIDEMQAVQFMPTDSWTTAGYGFQIWRENDRTFVGHAGTCPGAQSQLLLRPQERIAVIVLSNALGVETGRYAQRAYDVFSSASKGAVAEPTPQLARIRQLEGIYQRPLGSESAVIAWQGRLAIRSLPSASPTAGLEMFDMVSDSIFRRGSGPSAELVTFRPDGQGRMTMVRGYQQMIRRTTLERP